MKKIIYEYLSAVDAQALAKDVRSVIVSYTWLGLRKVLDFSACDTEEISYALAYLENFHAADFTFTIKLIKNFDNHCPVYESRRVSRAVIEAIIPEIIKYHTVF